MNFFEVKKRNIALQDMQILYVIFHVWKVFPKKILKCGNFSARCTKVYKICNHRKAICISINPTILSCCANIWLFIAVQATNFYRKSFVFSALKNAVLYILLRKRFCCKINIHFFDLFL